MNSYENLLGKNFAVGPVEMDKETLSLGGMQLPYFRTEEFSKLTLENEDILKRLVQAKKDARAIFLTTSGTGAMEASIMNLFKEGDSVLVVNGGGFGERFKNICSIFNLKVLEVKLNTGEALEEKHLRKYLNEDIKGFLINRHETSTGILYDMKVVESFCKKKNLILIVDSISSFLADEYNMEESFVDVTIIGSQKALALPPGLACIVLSKKAINKIQENQVKSLYFDLKLYLKDGERGQTPFTPAVGILIQLNNKLKKIEREGIGCHIKKVEEIANYFRERIKETSFKVEYGNLSNALTPIYSENEQGCEKLFHYLKDRHSIYLCPNGGELKDKMIRVGHIGEINKNDIDILIEALKEIENNERVRSEIL